MNEKELIEKVRLAIDPKFQDWVLFEHGTYVIVDQADTMKDVGTEALNIMSAFGPVHPGTPAGDFSVTKLNATEGWVVSGHAYGMYTYVSPQELANRTPTEIEIGLFGRAKRAKDGALPRIIHINTMQR